MQSMGLVNLAQGTKVLSDIMRLAKLRKLSVTGISRNNAAELCIAISSLSCLESLLLRAEGDIGLLGCLHIMPTTPRNLHCLKLYGTLGVLPPWIPELQSLVKLTLRSSRILDVETTIEALGKNLPNLTILRLGRESFMGQELSFSFRAGLFPNLKVMEFDRPLKLQSVEFNRGAMSKLEFLNFCAWYDEARVGLVSGLPYLTSLKHFTLSGSTYNDDFVEDLRAQIATNPNAPVFKRR